MSKCIRKGGEVMHINSISKIEEAAVFISMMNEDITQHVFSFQKMQEIELCLNTNNDGAMKLYKKVGFEEKACLQHYIIE
ncbi:hypothetical protein COO17_07740 [Bacillus wiedmannii]|uniref:N-acetyltransferase domain-containing protein n=1 Tax=Bacillus wiedmannii TaxID=1890302 RepID=A0A2A7BV76_9BACI|nr:hypothetical protein COO17_07740 [Bacillus wiedmannii]PFZ88591.1 hypothetical protein COL83_23610 [Bacillus wiedmannii]